MGANKVVIDVEARFNDGISGPAKAAAKAIDQIGKASREAQARLDTVKKKPYKPVFDADNSKFLKKLQQMENKANALGKTKTAVVLEATDKASNVIGKAMNTAQKFAHGAHVATLTIKAVGLNVVHKALSGLRSVAGKVWTATMRVKDFVTAPIEKLKSSLFTVKNLIAAIGAGYVIKKDVGMYKDYENLVTQFSVLLGSQDAAQKRMQDLVTFAGKTPFTRDEIFQASKVLQTYTNGALATPDATGGLTMIGDVAAATGEEFTRVANYFGRLYNEVQRGGSSLGEPLMMLREIGALSADAEEKITDIAQGSGTIDEKWAQIAQQFSKTDGMMEAMSNQLGNLLTGVKAFWKNTAEMTVGEGIAKSLKPFLNDFRTWRSENSALIAEWGARIKDMSQIISGKILGGVEAIASKAQGIMKSPEWDEASLGGKAKLLWKGLVSDPLTEWWTNGGREKTVAAAGKIGSEAGSLLSKGLTGLFRGIAGLTDEGAGLTEAGMEAGSSVAGAFIDGFLDNFDGGAVVGAFKDAVTGIWDSLPGWGKALAGMFIGSKVLGGIKGLLGSAGALVGTAGAAGAAGAAGIGATGTVVGASGLLGLLGRAGNIDGTGQSGLLGLGFKVGSHLPLASMPGVTALQASLVGLGTVAGGVTTGIGAIHAANSLAKANEQFTNGDTRGGVANSVRGLGTIAGGVGGALAGAKLGASVGALAGPAGVLIGAGLGTAVGWFASDKIAKNIEAAKFESQEMKDALKDSSKSAEELDYTFKKVVAQNLEDHFGDMRLSMDEISRLSDQLVWGDGKEKAAFEKFTAATNDANKSLISLNNAGKQTERWMWKAGLGVKFNEAEQGDIKSSFKSYIDSAQSYIENQHYAFTAAVDVLFEPDSPDRQGVLDSGSAWYTQTEEKAKQLGAELQEKIDTALKGDGIITDQEWEAIMHVQVQIDDVTNEVNAAEEKAKQMVMGTMYKGGKLQLSNGSLDYTSYQRLMEMYNTGLGEKRSTAEQALTTVLTSANGAYEASGKTRADRETYNKTITSAYDAYQSTLSGMRGEAMDFHVDLISDTYADKLGKDGATKVRKALDNALQNNDNPMDWSYEDLLGKFDLKSDQLGEDAAEAIKTMMGDAFQNLNPLEADQELLLNWLLDPETGMTEAEKKMQEARDRMANPEPIKAEQEVDVDFAPDFSGGLGPDSGPFSDANLDRLGILHPDPITADQEVVVNETFTTNVSKGSGGSSVIPSPEELRSWGVLPPDPMEETANANVTIDTNYTVNAGEAPTAEIEANVPDSTQAYTTCTIDTSYVNNGFFDPSTIAPNSAYSFGTTASVNPSYSVSNRFNGSAAMFGVNASYALGTAAHVNPSYNVGSKFNGSASTFGVKASYAFSTAVKVIARVATTVIGNPSADIAAWKKSHVPTSAGKFRGGIVGGPSALGSFARGGLIDSRSVQRFSGGGIVRGGSRLIQVAEEGSPEMVIPLSSQRRERGRKLWEMAGEMLKVPGFARGGLADQLTEPSADALSLPNVWQSAPAFRDPGSGRQTDNSADELRSYSRYSADAPGGSGEVLVEVGGITVNLTIQANDGGNIADAIRSHMGEITDAVVDVLTEAVEAGFANTPVKGGLAG